MPCIVFPVYTTEFMLIFYPDLLAEILQEVSKFLAGATVLTIARFPIAPGLTDRCLTNKILHEDSGSYARAFQF